MEGFNTFLLLHLVALSHQIRLGEICTKESDDLDCRSSFVDALCHDLVGPVPTCDCVLGFTQTGENSCRRTINGTCYNHPSECAIFKNKECDIETKQCRCIDPNVEVIGFRCEPKAGLGEFCNYNEQCEHITNSICKYPSFACTCQENYVQSNQTFTCLPTATLIGDDCEEDVQCIANLGSAICSEGKCSCRAGTVKGYNDFCGVAGGIGEPCKDGNRCEDASGNTSPIQCLGDPEGNHYYCMCKYNGVKAIEGSCYSRTGVGENCTSSQHCQAFISGPVFCHPEDNTCHCDKNYKGYKENEYAASKCILDI